MNTFSASGEEHYKQTVNTKRTGKVFGVSQWPTNNIPTHLGIFICRSVILRLSKTCVNFEFWKAFGKTTKVIY